MDKEYKLQNLIRKVTKQHTTNTSRRRENLFPELPYFNSPNVQFSTKNIKYMQKIKKNMAYAQEKRTEAPGGSPDVGLSRQTSNQVV